jgi:hypothetical protein
MITKRNLFAGGVIAILMASVLYTVGQKPLRKAQADSNLKHWLRLLRGSIGVHHPQSRDTVVARHRQASQPGVPAEIIGRTGYQLYP